MNNDSKSKRLDKIELQLTPKQWAIRLADQVRQYDSQEDFLKAIGKGTFRQSPFTMPFFALAQQAIQRWPGGGPKDIRREERLNRKLRTEFQALKMLINNINTEINIKAGKNRLKAELLLSKLQTLILKDTLAYVGVVETSSANQAQLHLLSELEDWADDSANILMQTTPYKTAIQTIQEDYFESHPILYKDYDIAFEKAIHAVRDAIAQFNEYLRVRDNLYGRESSHEPRKVRMANATLLGRKSTLPIDIEAVENRAEILVDILVKRWVKDAKFKAHADILYETGSHEDFVWEQFRKDIGLES